MTHACYLLRSLNPRFKTSFYIGCTTDPRRRLRQHNGAVGQGAQFTKKKRPWEMILCVYGFTSHVNALQFEWAWQHPLVSLAVKEAAAKLPSLKGVPGMIRLVCTMVTLPRWNSLNLTLQFMLSSLLQHRQGSPPLPPQMRLFVAPIDSLPGKDSGDDNDDNDDLSTCQDDVSQSAQLDEDSSYLKATSCTVVGQVRVTEGGSTAELDMSHDISSSPCPNRMGKKSRKGKTPQGMKGKREATHKLSEDPVLIDLRIKGSGSTTFFSMEQTSAAARHELNDFPVFDDSRITLTSVETTCTSSEKGVELLQESLKTFFSVKKQGSVASNIYRKSRNGEICKVLEEHSNTRNASDGVERKGKCSVILPDSKNSCRERIQDAVLIIDSDDDEKEGSVATTIYTKSTSGGICEVLDHSNGSNAPDGLESKGKCSVILPDSKNSCRERIQDAVLIIDSDDDEKEGSVATTIYTKSTSGGICDVLEDHSNGSNAPDGVESKGKCSGILPDSNSSRWERIQDEVLIMDSDDDEKEGSVATNNYTKSTNGEICKELEDHSSSSNARDGVESNGKSFGNLPDSKSSYRERIQDVVLIIDSDDDEIQEISATDFKQSTFVGKVGVTGRKERACSLINFR